VQLNHARIGLAWALALGALLPATRAHAMMLDQQSVQTLLQYFTDSDHVAVRSAIGEYSVVLRGNSSLNLHWNNERVEIPAVNALPGTPEAVDAITTASRPISGNAFQDFVKVRNEFQGDLKRGHVDVGYYHSSESDYIGQQVSAAWDRDLGGDQLNLAFGASYGWDLIEPVLDDDTNTQPDHKRTVHYNLVATRVLTPTTLVRVGVELNLVNGLQHNPYRNVYAGGTHVPERHPEERQRRDLFLKVHQYLSQRSSLKFNYRFYNDDWGIDSHELGATLSQYVTHGVAANWQYRWYTQSSADFYRDEYASVNGINGYLSGDYRMAALRSHLFGVGLDLDFNALEVGTPVLRNMGVVWNYERYFNSNNYSANFHTAQLTYRF
jgi:hypothetical protein